MKTGKLSQNVLRRSVLKNVSSSATIITGPGYGRDYAQVLINEGSIVTSTQTVIDTDNLIEYSVRCAIERALNNLWLSEARPFGIELSLTLSDRVSEKKLSEAMAHLESICQQREVRILGGNTIVSDDISRSVISVCAMGHSASKSAATRPDKRALAGLDIIVAGNIAAEECTKVTLSRRDELNTRLADWLLASVVKIGDALSVQEAANIARNKSIYMHDISSGGIFTALWEMGEYLDCGMEVDLHSIPVRQEIIEVCEFYELNPYEMDSAGSMLIVTEDSESILSELLAAGIRAARVGSITASKARIILSGEEKRFLDRA